MIGKERGNTMQPSWRPVTAGVLSIVAGALNLALGLLILFAGGILAGVLTAVGVPHILSFIPFPILAGAATPLCILGTVAVIGGSYAVRRRIWPMALAGAMCALFPPQLTILGVLAIVFVVLSKDEFR
jgi:hypothetical protein